MAKRSHTNRIFVHCSATPADSDIGAAEIRKWHTDPPPKGRGWADIGYHRVIRRDGTVENGRLLDEVGAHAKGHNADSVAVCLVGGVDGATGKPDCNFTAAQWAALEQEVRDLVEMYPGAEVIGHRNVSTKACPCFDAAEWWNGGRR